MSSRRKLATVKAVVIAAAATMFLAGSPRMAPAQFDAVIPLQRDYRGGLSCPANYEIRGNACVSILAGRGAPGRFGRDYGCYRYRDDYFGTTRAPRPPPGRPRHDVDGARATGQPPLAYR